MKMLALKEQTCEQDLLARYLELTDDILSSLGFGNITLIRRCVKDLAKGYRAGIYTDRANLDKAKVDVYRLTKLLEEIKKYE